MNNYEAFTKITTFIFDVDGVLTNGIVHVQQNGDLLRQMNIKDGYAIKHAVNKGYNVVIISGGKSEGVRIRLQNLGVKDVYIGVSDKSIVYNQVVEQYDLDEGEILYMGDDIPDYSVMRRVGLPTCPADAAQEVKDIAQYICAQKGGDGCARNVIEKVLKLRGDWME